MHSSSPFHLEEGNPVAGIAELFRDLARPTRGISQGAHVGHHRHGSEVLRETRHNVWWGYRYVVVVTINVTTPGFVYCRRSEANIKSIFYLREKRSCISGRKQARGFYIGSMIANALRYLHTQTWRNARGLIPG